MKKIEIILFSIYIMCTILSYFDIVGMEPLMVLIYLSVGLTYLVFSFLLFKYKNNGSTEESLPISIVSGLLIFLAILGSVFKQMMWPSSAVFTMIGVTGMIFVLTPIGIYRFQKRLKRNYYKFAIIRYLFVSLIAIIWFSIPSKTLNNHHQKKLEQINSK